MRLPCRAAGRSGRALSPARAYAAPRRAMRSVCASFPLATPTLDARQSRRKYEMEGLPLMPRPRPLPGAGFLRRRAGAAVCEIRPCARKGADALFKTRPTSRRGTRLPPLAWIALPGRRCARGGPPQERTTFHDLRFTRRVSLLPGLRANLSKSGVSLSIGHRRAWYPIGPRRRRATLGIPGRRFTGPSKSRRPLQPNAWRRSAFTHAAVLCVNRALRLLGKLAGG
jgi:hypothetical protein